MAADFYADAETAVRDLPPNQYAQLYPHMVRAQEAALARLRKSMRALHRAGMDLTDILARIDVAHHALKTLQANPPTEAP